MNNPSATFVSTGCLNHYRLAFTLTSSRWQGAAADILEDTASKVWGTVWRVDAEHAESLDRQEGVCTQNGQDVGNYRRISIQAVTPAGETLECRSYQVVNKTAGLDGQPSPAYKGVILCGAIESGLPDEYVESLQQLAHNEYPGPYEQIQVQDKWLQLGLK